MPTPAAAVAARETAAKTTEESHVVVDLRADNVLLPSHKGQFTLISFIVPGTAEVKDAEAAPVATAPAVPADVAEPDKGDAAVPEAEPLTVDGRYDVVLGEGTQMIYFGGGTSVVKGFVAGEDILLVDPALLEGPWEVTVPVNEGTAVLSFTDGSLLILQDLVLGAAYLTGA